MKMATTTLPPKSERAVKERSDTKPARAMTYPLRQANGPKKSQQKVKQGEPFDPDELTRRLQSYLVEQRIRSERRRAQRAAQAAAAAPKDENSQQLAHSFSSPGQENVYHHVPTVAAAAFSRTTTPNPLRQIHALSQPAVRAHLEQVQVDESSSGPKGLKKVQAMDQAVAQREALRQRNQFQRTQSMENAAELDGVRGVYKPQQRSFMGDSSHLAAKQEKSKSRPLSTGDVLEEQQYSSNAKSKRRPKPLGVEMAERNNWTQEEQVVEAKRKEKEKEGSSVRKKQSSWILLGLRSPRFEKEKDESVGGTSDAGSPPEVKSKASFLGRFKRHPS